MKQPLLLFLIWLVFPASYGLGQEIYTVNGKVIDAGTREPLPFVNIVINDGNTGGTTDIDGKFMLRSSQRIHSLRFSCLVYL